VAVSSDLHGWVSAEEAAERSHLWGGERALELRFTVARREFASAQAQGREVIGLATAALRRVGVTSEYALRAEVSADQVQVHAVVNDPSDALRGALAIVEERFGERAVGRGYDVERLEPRPGLSDLERALRQVERRVRAEAQALPASDRGELERAAREIVRSGFGRTPEAELER
jgi:hypothetical protein